MTTQPEYVEHLKKLIDDFIKSTNYVKSGVVYNETTIKYIEDNKPYCLGRNEGVRLGYGKTQDNESYEIVKWNNGKIVKLPKI
jgi:hypothetical protein